MTMLEKRGTTFLILCVQCFATVWAAVHPAGIFTDCAVLQQNEPVRIWGRADNREQVTVEFAGQKKTAMADDDGRWMITLEPMPVSAAPREMIFSSSTGGRQVISNVLVGEVWLAGGQSNMETTMANYSRTVQPDIDRANDPLLRMVTIPRLEYPGQNSRKPQWKHATPQDVKQFSATAYYFARNLREALDVPVGIISCSVGATPAEAWMSRETLSSDPLLKKTLDAYETGYRRNFPNQEIFRQKYEEATALVKEFYRKKSAGEDPGPFPPPPPMGPLNYKRPGGLYETMLKQAIPYTVKGVIWYQGESNANAPAGYHYRHVFSALIEEWRADFQNPQLPFLFVQLATFGGGHVSAPYWPELRDSQRWVDDHVENTGMAVLVDGGEEKDIHPHSKPLAGHRLALLARNMVYGETDPACNGPRLINAIPAKNRIELTFDQPPVLNDAAESAFEICGADGSYVPASAKIENGKVIVFSESVSEPQFVRYGWKQWFEPTLFNRSDLPASPFKTDDFLPETKNRYYLDTL